VAWTSKSNRSQLVQIRKARQQCRAFCVLVMDGAELHCNEIEDGADGTGLLCQNGLRSASGHRRGGNRPSAAGCCCLGDTKRVTSRAADIAPTIARLQAGGATTLPSQLHSTASASRRRAAATGREASSAAHRGDRGCLGAWPALIQGVAGVGTGSILRISKNDKAPPYSAQLRGQTLTPHSSARSSASRNH
jgi:hypothetical protein